MIVIACAILNQKEQKYFGWNKVCIVVAETNRGLFFFHVKSIKIADTGGMANGSEGQP